jgi:hypothetical protein
VASNVPAEALALLPVVLVQEVANTSCLVGRAKEVATGIKELATLVRVLA